MMPEWVDGRVDFKLAMAELRRSMANAGVETPGSVLVSIVPMGVLGSPLHPFMAVDNEEEHNIYLCFNKKKKKKKH